MALSLRLKTIVISLVGFLALLTAFDYVLADLDWPFWAPFAVTTLAFVVIMAVFLEASVLKGLRHITDAVRSITATNNISARLSQDEGTREVADLSGSINELLDRCQKSQRGLLDTQATLRAIVDNMLDAVFHIDLDGVVKYASPSCQALVGHSPEEMMGKSLCEYIHKDDVTAVRRVANQAVELLTMQTAEFRMHHANGKYVWVEGVGKVLFDRKRSLTGGIVCCRDITQRVAAENRLKYLSLHDALTGLYNRNYFRHEMLRLASSRHERVGLIVCDVDGLKLYNDSLGHDAGDMLLKAAANVLRKSFRESDVVSRIGGDEFAVLLPDATPDIMEQACKRIREQIDDYNANQHGLSLSMSMGWALTDDLDNVGALFKEADDNMYREKLHRSRSTRSAIVDVLLKTLESQDFDGAGGHRMQDTTAKFARFVDVPEEDIADIRLLAKFHDIGQVGIPDAILFKEAPLTSSEMAKMQTHCEIGYRIALSDPNLTPIADWILKHHEWWNGQGYPTGVAGMDIPLECRILAIVDAYDAMTNSRPYRKPLTQDEALAELQRCAGTQFDPTLVEKFCAMMNISQEEEE